MIEADKVTVARELLEIDEEWATIPEKVLDLNHHNQLYWRARREIHERGEEADELLAAIKATRQES